MGTANFYDTKKDGTVRWVSDLREINKVVKKTQYTLPIITDVLRQRKGYEFLTKLDIFMMFYTFSSEDESSKMCTIVTPFGSFQYTRIPMGLVNSPAFAQSRMEEVLYNSFAGNVLCLGPSSNKFRLVQRRRACRAHAK